jgi:NAD(P)-dependent dehydrogenase (short-subunit alcohol dehydrogenase family)
MDTSRLEGKTAVITGAGQGIGRAIAERFIAEGAQVVIGDIDADLGRRTVSELGATRVAFVPCDVGEPAQCKALIARAVEIHGNLDICVNNAGINRNGDVLDMDVADFDAVMRVNVKGTFFVAQAAARAMVEAGTRGSIINLASVVALLAVPDQPAYCVSKAAVNGFTRMLAVTLADKGIRVNAIGPGTIKTDMSDAVLGYGGDQSAFRRVMARTPLGRLGQVEEIAAVAAFLASDEAGYMTGQTIYPDGGRLALNHLMPMTW